jgi:protein-disulfide isomerase
MFLIALVGLFVASYLFVTYTSGAPIVCGSSHGCDVVRVSQWATMFGIPTPLMGMMFYTSIAALLIARTAMPAYKPKLMYRLTILGVTISIIESAFLTFVQAFEIKQFCIWCLVSAVCAALLFIIAWWDRAEVLEIEKAMKELKIQFFALLVAGVIGTIAIVILTIPQTDGELPVLRPVEVSDEQERIANELLSPEGLTYEGPEDAEVTVTEFIDFQCPACAEAHPEIAQALDALEGKVRFAYRHFPLPTHAQAKGAAYATVCADNQGMLFEYADVLIEEQANLERDNLVRYAAELRLNLDDFVPCLESQETKETVEQDLHDGDALGVNSTPTIFVNNLMIDGLPNAEQLKEIIEAELEK